MDIIGTAILDFYSGNYTKDIITTSSLDEEDNIPLPYLFRRYREMPIIEQKALQHCKGKVLDIGCGAGSHSLWLQEQGHTVTGIDNSKGAITVCNDRGIKNTVHGDVMDYKEAKFDTLILMMNGIGIVGKLTELASYLSHFKTLLNAGGQILLDSSDIRYMFDEDADGGFWVPDTGHYYGEVEFKMSYKGIQGDVFSWLYLDYNTLQSYALENGFKCELLQEGPHYNYLAKLTLKAY